MVGVSSFRSAVRVRAYASCPLMAGLLLFAPSSSWGQQAPAAASSSESSKAQPLVVKAPPPAAAEDPGYLFDWRPVGAPLGDALAAHGIYLHSVMQQSYVGIAEGGHNQASQYVNLSYSGFDVDTQKAFGLQGGFFRFTLSDEAGNTANASNSVGSNALFPFAFVNAVRLVDFYYNQSWANHDVQVTVGRMQSGYSTTPYLSPGIHATEWQCLFFSTSCGDTSAYANDSNKAPYPVGAWGAKVTVHPAANWYVMAGAFENEPIEVTTPGHNGWPGPDWNLDQAMGWFLPVQLGYISPANTLYPTNFHIGGYYDSAKFPDKLLNVNLQPVPIRPGAPLLDTGAYGVYMALQQTVYRPSADPQSTRGLSVFVTADFDLSRQTTIAEQFYAGFVFDGPFAQRPRDRLDFLATAAFYDPRQAQDRDLIAAIHGLNYTMKPQIAFELNYGIAAAPGVTIYPFTQYIINPDQLGLAIPDPNDRFAITFGVRTTIRFDTLFGLPQAQ